jgi:FtsP/CotA-like multicopper oxidase with cupredoxin domain
MERRSFLRYSALSAGAAWLARAAGAQAQAPSATATANPKPGAPGARTPLVTPHVGSLAYRTVGGVKVFHLVAAPVDHEFAPGMRAECWGYNGTTPGPTIEAVEGDHVRIYVTNQLPEPTTVHWHGVVVPNGMDGVAGLTQRAIPVGETFMYEFTLRAPGTFMYHPHFDEMTQIGLGMSGMFVVHPRTPRGPRVDRDFAVLTHEWRLPVGARRPNPSEMSDFNVLTFNSKVFPATAPWLVGRGERVRIRLGNLSAMDHHPIHFHGLSFKVTGTDGGFIPESAQRPETTVLVPVGTTRTLEFVPSEAGDWAVHCHMTHHTMTQMGHGLPLLLGANTRALDHSVRELVPHFMSMGQKGMGDMGSMQMAVPGNSLPMRGGPGPFATIDMGGMFTVLKVREEPEKADPAGWYAHPAGSVAGPADAQRMAADGVEVAAVSEPSEGNEHEHGEN